MAEGDEAQAREFRANVFKFENPSYLGEAEKEECVAEI